MKNLNEPELPVAPPPVVKVPRPTQTPAAEPMPEPRAADGMPPRF